MAALWDCQLAQSSLTLYEGLWTKALKSASVSAKVWYRYVDDTYVVINKDKGQEFTDHINRQNPHIKFINDLEKNGQFPFLGTLVKRQSDGRLQVSVYRKSAHTDQYLPFDSHHPLELSVRKLFHRPETVATTPEDKDSELKHVKTSLTLVLQGRSLWPPSDFSR